MSPTKTAYGELQKAYDFFNEKLFESKLPPCLMTLQRKKNMFGYFSSNRFDTVAGNKTDEIVMNPTHFATAPLIEVMQTVVHEMVHLWQAHFGKPGRRAYHNKEWGQKMESVGLMPSNTGKPGGKKTGEKMSDYPIKNGRFIRAYEELATSNFTITWRDAIEIEKTNEAAEATNETEALGNRKKFTCIKCETNAWGKPTLKIICGECMSPMIWKAPSYGALRVQSL